MYIQSLLNVLTRSVIPVALLLSVYLYLYPVFNGCAFPATDGLITSSFRDTIVQHVASGAPTGTTKPTSLAPFRLLVLADPQLEGDSSLPGPEDALVPKLRQRWKDLASVDPSERVRAGAVALQEAILEDAWASLRGLRKRIDLFGNDYYLAHIFRTLRWWSQPTHVTVLGDLIGSQWVSDDEFEWRGWRYWNRVFAGGERVRDELITLDEGETEKVFALDDEAWKSRIINIAGNHDIGYAGDISNARLERFEQVFGKANWDVRFEYPSDANTTAAEAVHPSIQMIILNDMILDSPALSDELQAETVRYLNSIISDRNRPVEDRTSFTLLLTHVPLFKKEAVCVDPPFFDFWGSDDGGGVYKPHGLKEQNHLSQGASEPGVLESVFGMKGDANVPAYGKGRNGLILTGHDHAGCDVWHYVPVNSTYDSTKDEDRDKQTQWEAVRWQDADRSSSHTGVREVTLRSMMGDYSGNAGLLSAWFDFDAGEWRHDIQMCKMGVQHIWWAIHVIDLVAIVLVILNLTLPSPRKPVHSRKAEKPARKEQVPPKPKK